MKTSAEAASRHPVRHIRNLAAMRGKRHGFLRFTAALAAAAQLAGCASTGKPTERENAAVLGGERTIVLLRVVCAIENQQAFEPFASSLVDDNVSFGLGTFETGGVPVRSSSLRFPSPASRNQGWTYFVLPHGTCYLAVYPPRRTGAFAYDRSLINTPRWRIDIPQGAGLVYAGTLHLTGKSDWLIGGGRIMNSIQHAATTVGNEQARAGKIAAECFPELGRMQVALMRRHEGGPVILKSPLP